MCNAGSHLNLVRDNSSSQNRTGGDESNILLASCVLEKIVVLWTKCKPPKKRKTKRLLWQRGVSSRSSQPSTVQRKPCLRWTFLPTQGNGQTRGYYARGFLEIIRYNFISLKIRKTGLGGGFCPIQDFNDWDEPKPGTQMSGPLSPPLTHHPGALALGDLIWILTKFALYPLPSLSNWNNVNKQVFHTLGRTTHVICNWC